MSTSDTTAGSRFIGTANHGFAVYAQEELRRLFSRPKFVSLVPGEIFLMETDRSGEDVIAELKRNEPMLLRHIQPACAALPAEGTAADIERLKRYVKEELRFRSGEKVAVQVRITEGTQVNYTPYGVKEAVDPVLMEAHGAEPVVREADRIISVLVTTNTMYAGVSRPEDNLSDWSGGAVRFRREEGQISRAKFKLLEAEYKFALDFAQFNRALDIGAAPGGWTSLLLERGLSVTAVDPGELHPTLTGHPRLTYLRKNAGDVTFADEAFDLLVCDMSWSPRQMIKLVSGLLHALESGGTAIITLKLMHGKPFQAVKEAVGGFRPALELRRAKQLFHNRDELTLYFRKI